MNPLQKLKTLVKTSIPFLPPKELNKLAKVYSADERLLEKETFEWPPKTEEEITSLLLNGKYETLKFFDIARLLVFIENDKTLALIQRDKICSQLYDLYNHKQKYIQNLILRTSAKVLLQGTIHGFFNSILKNISSLKELSFVHACVQKKYDLIYKMTKNQSFAHILKFYGLLKLFSDLPDEYAKYLLKKISQMYLTQENYQTFFKNLLITNDFEQLYHQIDKILSMIEKKTKIENNTFLENLLLQKLGGIDDTNSKWITLDVPADLQERYKRLKGLFEFQRFVDIAKFLSEYGDLRESNVSSDGKTNDATRILNRSIFWSNYDERFSSVRMWVSENDFRLLELEKPVDLKDIQQIKGINNEACLLEFKDVNLLILEFFRLKDNRLRFEPLIFESNINTIKEAMEKYKFNLNLYEQLEKHADYTISHKFLWQGWVDKFLRDRNIYPNTSILQGRKFQSSEGRWDKYTKEYGLDDTRAKAYMEGVLYEDVIIMH